VEATLSERDGSGRAHRLAEPPGWGGYTQREAERLSGLIGLFAELPEPPDPFGLYPRYAELKDRLLLCIEARDAEALEEAFLLLYAHVHGYEVPYTPGERSRVEETGGYLSHVGGLSPILKAAPFIGPDSVSGDFGAGNGLQGLLIQKLTPHARTVQIEISSRMVEAGRLLQAWLGVPEGRVDWIVGDVAEVSPAGMDFVYLYRPVRPVGAGEAFYRSFAAQLGASAKPAVIFSVADCLQPHLPPDFEVFYSDGHLTCFRRRGVQGRSNAA
jgi:hypothetical protein